MGEGPFERGHDGGPIGIEEMAGQDQSASQIEDVEVGEVGVLGPAFEGARHIPGIDQQGREHGRARRHLDGPSDTQRSMAFQHRRHPGPALAPMSEAPGRTILRPGF